MILHVEPGLSYVEAFSYAKLAGCMRFTWRGNEYPVGRVQ